jgi:hypothetical protein
MFRGKILGYFSATKSFFLVSWQNFGLKICHENSSRLLRKQYKCFPPFCPFHAEFQVAFCRRRHRQPRIGVEFDFAALFREEIFCVRLVGDGLGKLGVETRNVSRLLSWSSMMSARSFVDDIQTTSLSSANAPF